MPEKIIQLGPGMRSLIEERLASLLCTDPSLRALLRALAVDAGISTDDLQQLRVAAQIDVSSAALSVANEELEAPQE